MQRFADALFEIALTLWVGSLWTIGYVVAPLLFHVLTADRQLAGFLAGRFFEAGAWLGLACAAYLLFFKLLRNGTTACRQRFFWLALLMLLLTLVGLFGVQPLLAQLKADALPREVLESVLRNRFATWHGVSSVLYLLQSVLGLLLVANVGGRSR